MTSGLTPEEQRRLAAVETKLELAEELIKELRDDIKAIRSSIDQAKGSWKLLLAVGAFGAAMAEVLHQVYSWLHGVH